MFRKNHPYLFWQLISWGIVIVGAGTSFIGMLNNAGEWIYPVVVFSLIFGIAMSACSPVLVSMNRKNMLPDKTDNDEKNRLQSRIMQIEAVRKRESQNTALTVIVMTFAFLSPFLAAYFLGKYVHIALGVVCLGAFAAVPLLWVLTDTKRTVKRFYKVEHGEKYVYFTEPSDRELLFASEAITLILPKMPSAATLNFLYNWLCDYLYDRRISAHVFAASELPLNKTVLDEIFGEDFGEVFFLCVPFENLRKSADLGDLAERLIMECGAVGAFPLNYLLEQNKIPAD